MRSTDDVIRVFALEEQGLSQAAIARASGVSRPQVRAWLKLGRTAVLDSPMRRAQRANEACWACRNGPSPDESPVDERSYAYLLGQYLGDGCISEGPRGAFKLRIQMCDSYPSIRAECEAAIRSIMPGRAVGGVQREGCTEVYCCSKHWPCLFPQHGRGVKHARSIRLLPWQERIAYDRHPQALIRGLIHSDGCRTTNRVTRELASGRKQYAYPRYFFDNVSADIRGIFIEACRRLRIDVRPSKPTTLSVARRDSVALLDSYVGPKS